MNRISVFAIGLISLTPAAFAQTAANLDPGSSSQVMQRQEMLNRQILNAEHDLARAERQSWLNSIANLEKLRIKLAEAWQSMGVSPQGAELLADAYDPDRAARLHLASLRGKIDEEIAQLLDSAIRHKHYLSADQLLIDYQRNKLRIGADPAPAVNW